MTKTMGTLYIFLNVVTLFHLARQWKIEMTWFSRKNCLAAKKINNQTSDFPNNYACREIFPGKSWDRQSATLTNCKEYSHLKKVHRQCALPTSVHNRIRWDVLHRILCLCITDSYSLHHLK